MTTGKKSFLRKLLKTKAFWWFIVLLSFIYIYQNRFYLYESTKYYYHKFTSREKNKFERKGHIDGLGIKLPKYYSVYGIDVSKHQGKINWEKLSNQEFKNKSFSFVFIKASEGATWKDGFFNKNWENAKNTQLICGAYHFYIPGRSATNQINNFFSDVKLESGDLPPVLDVEKINPKYTIKQHREEISAILRGFEKRYKVKPILYTNLDIFENLLNTEEFKNYPLWIAKYHFDEPVINRRWKFWQFSEEGIVDGVEEFVDINVFRGTLKELKQMQIP